MDLTIRRAEIPPPEEAALRAAPQRGAAAFGGRPPFVDSSVGGISALRLVRSVHSCAMLAKSVFFVKTKVLCPAAASGVFFWPKNWPGPEKVEHLSAKINVHSV